MMGKWSSKWSWCWHQNPQKSSLQDFCGFGTLPHRKKEPRGTWSAPAWQSLRRRLHGSLGKGVPDSQAWECYHQCQNGWRQRTVHHWDLICPPAVSRCIKGQQGRDLEGKQSWSGSPMQWVTCSFWSLSLKKAHRLQGTPPHTHTHT